MLSFNDVIPLSLYVHLPWCVKKCPYCDFNSHEFSKVEIDEQKYIDALIRDLETELPRVWGRQIISIFLGGGTPSLFSVDAMDHLLAGLRARLSFYPEIEITMEVNPGTAEAEKFKGFRKIGINRLSIGIQSFNDQHLNVLGRIHNAEEAKHAIGLCQKAGFDDFNLDLMFGLPGQTVDEAILDLQTAIEFQPKHLSWYQLTIEPNTVYAAKPPQLPLDDDIWEIQSKGQQFLSNSGFDQYEISAYAKKGYRCAHNLNYWEFGDYLGIGAGAHGKITHVAEDKVERYQRHKIPSRYMELAGTEKVITEEKSLSSEDLCIEFMMNGLRLNEGITSSQFFSRAGQPITKVNDKLALAEDQGLIEWRMDSIKPTEKGSRYLNELLQIFVN